MSESVSAKIDNLVEPNGDKEKSEANPLELFYLTKACNAGFIKPSEWFNKAYDWARRVIETTEEQNESAI